MITTFIGFSALVKRLKNSSDFILKKSVFEIVATFGNKIQQI